MSNQSQDNPVKLAGPPAAQYHQHHLYWDPNGDVIFKDPKTNVGYKVSTWIFKNSSEGFKMLIDVHQERPVQTSDSSQASSVEPEGSELNPHHLFMPMEEWENFLCFIYRFEWDVTDQMTAPQKLQLYINILKVAHLFECKGAYVTAKQALVNPVTFYPERSPLTATKKLQLGIMYGIPEWIEPSLCLLITRDVNMHSEKDVEDMTLLIFRYVVQGAWKFTFQCYKLVKSAPDFRPKDCDWPPCATHSNCVTLWKQFWNTYIVPKVTAETCPLWFDDIIWVMDENPGRLHMSNSCMKAAREYFLTVNTRGDTRAAISTALSAVIIKRFEVARPAFLAREAKINALRNECVNGMIDALTKALITGWAPDSLILG
ncbi:hypothetical protein C8J56DRAFT_900413 [Mycena floridula]|nr:hypothetical protein C8J56DRAFT_900413 [Mycena floridula]